MIWLAYALYCAGSDRTQLHSAKTKAQRKSGAVSRVNNPNAAPPAVAPRPKGAGMDVEVPELGQATGVAIDV
eukprot:COSAG02_NODE_30_length_50867_cov_66.594331_4_plen_72_part_00